MSRITGRWSGSSATVSRTASSTARRWRRSRRRSRRSTTTRASGTRQVRGRPTCSSKRRTEASEANNHETHRSHTARGPCFDDWRGPRVCAPLVHGGVRVRETHGDRRGRQGIRLAQSALVRAHRGDDERRQDRDVESRVGLQHAVVRGEVSGDAHDVEVWRSHHRGGGAGPRSRSASHPHLLDQAAGGRVGGAGSRRVNKRLLPILLALLTLLAPRATFAQGRGGGGQQQSGRAGAIKDLTGYWVSVVAEHWHLRMMVPPKGDTTMLPVNAEARRIAKPWAPAK